MKLRPTLLVSAALGTALPVAIALAQTAPPAPAGPPPAGRQGPSADTLARLQDGRIAMAKAALKLNEAQLKLWAPVEEQLRTAYADRQKAREARRQGFEERRQAQRQGHPTAGQPSLPERLDRASQRMAERAERMKAFSTAFKPFYESLSDEQKVVAGIVLRDMRGGFGGRRGHRWALHGGPGEAR